MSRCANPKISTVIPARDEARNLELVLPELSEVEQIVLVAGWSVDGTRKVARRVRPSTGTVTRKWIGKGNALARGFEAARGDVVVMFDADGSADPAEIPAFVQARGADFAKGTRFHPDGGSEGGTALRRTGNAVLNQLTNLLFGTDFTDLRYGYNAFWRDIVLRLGLPPADIGPGADQVWGDGFEIEIVLDCRAAAAGLEIVEVPSVERRRVFGGTNPRTFADGTRVLRAILIEYGRRRARRRQRLSPAGGVTAGGLV
ncbi:MAG TPA: glycosyltransferase family 2 protein [Amycolatopsis sp.]|uniref:glycosyltransferase family 2 protein n=1 Tax=Amycolatopsis sp. TaxID=37632 RepID=UPI002B459833|nr:glycosyltransferase family 2 protein [Amycolatopsis sp.]HKS45684.1 glycosyltransferase family 2 protein [Amycolatopsis sp.]